MLSDDDLERYARQAIMPAIGEEGQEQLLAARVLVVGAGGLGAPVIMYLAAAGVGTIGVIDDDVVESSNLQRQIIHNEERLGMAKVFSAQAAMTALNAFRPRRWRGALLPKKAHVRFEVMDPEKRPVMADADSTSISNVAIVDITSEEHVQHRLLFDPGHGLDERLLQEQFV